MTDAEIDAIADARIKAAQTPTAASSIDASTKPSGEDDVYEKEHAARLAEMHKMQAAAEVETKDKKSLWDPAAAIYSTLPDAAKTAANVAGSVAGFGALRKKLIPEKYQYGTPERFDEQAAQRLTKAIPEAVDPHAELRAQHEAAQKALKQAELTQKYYENKTAAEMPEQRPNRFGDPARIAALRGYAVPSTPTPGLPLTGNLPTLETVPVGGPATFKYAREAGATTPEAMNTPSYSSWQKAIPGHAEALTRGQNLMPGAVRLASSDLIVGPETQRQLQQEMAAKQQADAKALEAKTQALARSRAYALADVKRAQEAEAMRRQVLASAEAQARPAPPTTPRQRALAAWENIGRIGGTATKGKISAPGVATNLGAGVMPYFAEKAQEAWDKDRLQAAAYGLGAAGGAGMATGNPYGIALGSLATLPAWYYEYMNRNNPPVKP